MNRKLRVRLLFIAGLLLLWQAVIWSGFWPNYLFPGPWQVLKSLGQAAADGSLLAGVGSSLARLLGGYLISAVLGVGLGLLVSRYALLEESLGFIFLGLQTLPSICWLPLALIWFGLNERAILFVVVMGSVLSIAMATEAGIRHVSPVWVRAARTMGASGARLYASVVLPAAFPAILGGLKQGWSFAWRSLMAAELLYHTVGLGSLLDQGRELNDASRVLAVILVIVVLGALIDRLIFGPLQKRILSLWGLGNS